jgi:hypothetical protein
MIAPRTALLLGVPAAFSGLLWLHPMIGDYEGLQDVTTRFQAIHVAMVLTFCLLAVAMHSLLDRLAGRAAVARLARSSSPRCSRSAAPAHR